MVVPCDSCRPRTVVKCCCEACPVLATWRKHLFIFLPFSFPLVIQVFMTESTACQTSTVSQKQDCSVCVSQSDGGCCCFSSRPLWLWVPQGCSVWLGRGASLLIPCPAAPLGLLRADSETTGLFVACQTCGLQVLAMISVHPCHVLEAGCLSNKCTESVGLGCVLLAGRVWSTLPLDVLLFQEDFFCSFSFHCPLPFICAT